ncbi:glutamate racemase [Leminorella grimontii]|uniref:Glutamate racemase n=1 Tax=Leminorella grimontii TaxID=82981 RepID=A0AAV5N4K8_9GAMM|nr:glutamate racemase [Leminorella grimontii]KFC92566.1 glutamate racemase [Leminorella grimontii ATCC 33999 = DSM 5078]GKX57060.1 glutamate racemase [Leminorella grimontii]VFS62445.1 Glutamate racemase [Leminorella grimontii]
MPTALVFDSGVGGLSVYREIRQLMPDLSTIYAFDNAGFPYGEKDESTIAQRVVAMVEAICQRHAIDIIVVACNTASVVALSALRERLSIPIVGVVPAVKPAAKLTRNGIVGLLATNVTVNRPYTHDLIAQFAQDCRIELMGASRLVEMAEEKLHGHDVSLEELKGILSPWLNAAVPPDTVVLGCTHFPLLKEELAQVLPEGVVMIDSGAAIARRVKSLLDENGAQWGEHSAGIAYCSRKGGDTEKLWPALRQLGFESLHEQAI